MNDVQTLSANSAGAHIRAYRKRADLSLDDLADRIQKAGYDRPSTAKLSRSETGVQPVPLDLLEPLVTVARIPARMLRPDLWKLFTTGSARPRRRRAA